MSIGYACVHIGSEKTKLSSIRLSNASDDKLKEVISANLNALGHIVKYNISNNIKLYRISSDIIPLGSHPANRVKWWHDFKPQLESIGEKIFKSGMRVSMHPGQYTVLNSLRDEVVTSAVKDLEYHNTFLDSIKCDYRCKIIIHIGGIYSDKSGSIERFIKNFQLLSDGTKRRIVIENDDKSYNINDVLYISKKTGVPVVFDNLHHELNPPPINNYNEYEWIELAAKTWGKIDGRQKIHYSQSGINRKRGAHSGTIFTAPFMNFYKNLPTDSIDIMLEVKDKNLSAIKCVLITTIKPRVSLLEKEWARYKYFVLSRSASTYKEISCLFRNNSTPDPVKFYLLIEKALLHNGNIGSELNAAMHIWGYFKNKSDERDKKKFKKLSDGFKNSDISLNTLKNFLFRLAQKHDSFYLLESLYFYL